MLAALVVAVLVYPDVPAEVTRVSAYEWRAGGPPAPLAIAIARDGPRLTITLPVSAAAVLVLERPDGSYLIDGPIAPESGEVERQLDRVWRRTVHGDAPGRQFGTPTIEWLAATDGMRDVWPACWWTSPAKWTCFGLALDAAGVVLAGEGERMWSGVVRTRSPVSLRPSRWGRLVVIRDRGPDAPPRLTVTAARPAVPPQRTRSVRVEAAVLDDVRATRVEPAVIWIAGDSSPPAAWLEIRSARSGPAYLPLTDATEGSPQVPLRVLLDDSRPLDVLVTSDRGEPAATALVTVFRLIDPPPRAGGNDPPPRRVFASESVTDEQGRVRVEGLGDAAYQIVAWHPRFGRGSLMLSASADRVTVHLQSPGIARGRVLAGGKPAAGIEVTVVPDLLAFAAAEDPIDLQGGGARTGPDGRFAVTMAMGGGGELRVGGGTHRIKRVPLPRAPLPIVELGDIELGRPLSFSIVLDQDPGCDVRATGPVGRSGLRIVTAARTAPGVFTVALPEEGIWEFGLLCGREERDLAPAVVRVSDQTPSSLTFVVR